MSDKKYYPNNNNGNASSGKKKKTSPSTLLNRTSPSSATSHDSYSMLGGEGSKSFADSSVSSPNSDSNTVNTSSDDAATNLSSSSSFFSDLSNLNWEKISKCFSQISFAPLMTGISILLLIITLSSFLSALFNGAFDTSNVALELLAKETVLSTTVRVEGTTNRAVRSIMMAKNLTERVPNPWSTSPEFPNKNVNARLWDFAMLGYASILLDATAINMRWLDDSVNLLAVNQVSGNIKAQACQSRFKHWNDAPTTSTVDARENCTLVAYHRLAGERKPDGALAETPTQTWSLPYGPYWNLTSNQTLSRGISGFWAPSFRMAIFPIQSGVDDGVRRTRDLFQYFFFTMSFEKSNPTKPLAFIGGVFEIASFSATLKEVLPNNGTDNGAQSFLIEPRGGNVLGASHVPRNKLIRVVHMNESGGHVWKGCYKHIAYMGCFYNVSDYAPFRPVYLVQKYSGAWREVLPGIYIADSIVEDDDSGGSGSSSGDSYDADGILVAKTKLKNAFPDFALEFILIIPRRFFVADVIQARRVSIAISVVIIIIGSVLLFFAMKFSTRSLKILVKKMKDPWEAKLRSSKLREVEKQKQKNMKQKDSEEKDSKSNNNNNEKEQEQEKTASVSVVEEEKGGKRVNSPDSLKSESSGGYVSRILSENDDDENDSEKSLWEQILEWQPEEIVAVEEEFAVFRATIGLLRGFMNNHKDVGGLQTLKKKNKKFLDPSCDNLLVNSPPSSDNKQNSSRNFIVKDTSSMLNRSADNNSNNKKKGGSNDDIEDSNDDHNASNDSNDIGDSGDKKKKKKKKKAVKFAATSPMKKSSSVEGNGGDFNNNNNKGNNEENNSDATSSGTDSDASSASYNDNDAQQQQQQQQQKQQQGDTSDFLPSPTFPAASSSSSENKNNHKNNNNNNNKQGKGNNNSPHTQTTPSSPTTSTSSSASLARARQHRHRHHQQLIMQQQQQHKLNRPPAQYPTNLNMKDPNAPFRPKSCFVCAIHVPAMGDAINQFFNFEISPSSGVGKIKSTTSSLIDVNDFENNDNKQKGSNNNNNNNNDNADGKQQQQKEVFDFDDLLDMRQMLINFSTLAVEKIVNFATSCGSTLIDFHGDDFVICIQLRLRVGKTKIPSRVGVGLEKTSASLSNWLTQYRKKLLQLDTGFFDWRGAIANAHSTCLYVPAAPTTMSKKNSNAASSRNNAANSTSTTSTSVGGKNDNDFVVSMSDSNNMETPPTTPETAATTTTSTSTNFYDEEAAPIVSLSAGFSVGNTALVSGLGNASGAVRARIARPSTFVGSCVAEALMIEREMRFSTTRALFAPPIQQGCSAELTPQQLCGGFAQTDEVVDLRRHQVEAISMHVLSLPPHSMGFFLDQKYIYLSIGGWPFWSSVLLPESRAVSLSRLGTTTASTQKHAATVAAEAALAEAIRERKKNSLSSSREGGERGGSMKEEVDEPKKAVKICRLLSVDK